MDAAARAGSQTVEPGPLRAELGGAPLPSAPPPEPDGAFVSRMTFTGRDEYFRIRAANLFSWARRSASTRRGQKVRKTKYFWQNTQLDGHVFDFHGKPAVILRGRVVALVLLVAYMWGFEFFTDRRHGDIVVLLALGPWLFVKPEQFRFATKFRGLRFGFAASYRDALSSCCRSSSCGSRPTSRRRSLRAQTYAGLVGAARVTIVTLLLIPGMTTCLKVFQHDCATYGERRFAFRPALAEFYWIYAQGLLLLLLGGICGALLFVFIPLMFADEAGPEAPEWLWIVNAGAVALTLFVFAGPFLAARVQQLLGPAHTQVEERAFPHRDRRVACCSGWCCAMSD